MTGLEIIWFFLPAGVANMAPVLFKKLPLLDYPISEKLFGAHKTWRGLVVGILAAIVVVFIQSIWQADLPVFKLGLALGAGALLGDLVKSFFKRRVGIPPGQGWVPFDQIDWIVGAVIAVMLIQPFSFYAALFAIVFFSLLHPVINLIGYWLGIKKNKF